MTLEEAIIHCEEKACGNTQCALEHRQLAEWLRELQQYRKTQQKNENEHEEEKVPKTEEKVPKTVDEAVSMLGKILSDEDRKYLLENGAISMHDSLGRWIRNEWGLWTGSELKDELMNMNKGLNHPDDMSNYIIEEFIKYWNNKS